MRNCLKIMKVPLLVFVLLAIVVLPYLLLTYQNRNDLGEVHMESYTAQWDVQNLEETNSQKEGYLIKDLIDTMLLFVESHQGRGIQIVVQEKDIDPHWESELLNKLSVQIAELQELNAVPFFEMRGQGNLSGLNLLKLFNQESKNDRAQLWEISVDYDEVSVVAYMDAKTSRIVNIYVRSDFYPMSLDSIPFKNFMHYLGFKDDQIAFEHQNDILYESIDIHGTYQFFYDDLIFSFDVIGNHEFFKYTLSNVVEISKSFNFDAKMQSK